nr:integrase, catalytic region, zinc finger, CCHC-type, peptidase aspartic, catalytic [Tanacetum cinerariifolium]
MSTQQDIYAAGSENRLPMLNKDNYVPWSSRLLCYEKSKPNEKLLVNLITNDPYVRRIIHEHGDPNNVPPVAEFTYEQIDDELTDKDVKKIKVDDQANQTILMGLPEDIYAVVDSCDTTQEIWLRGEQIMKGIANENANQTGNGNVVAARAEGNGNGTNGILISRVYFVEGLGHNLLLVGKFCDLDLEFAFRRNICNNL